MCIRIKRRLCVSLAFIALISSVFPAIANAQYPTIEFIDSKLETRIGETNQTFVTVNNTANSRAKIFLGITEPSSEPRKFWVFFPEKQYSARPNEIILTLEPNEKVAIPIALYGGQTGSFNIQITAINQNNNLRKTASIAAEVLPEKKTFPLVPTPEPGLFGIVMIAILGSLIIVSKKPNTPLTL